MVPWRQIRRLMPMLLCPIICLVILHAIFFYEGPTVTADEERDHWVSARLAAHQKEYVDRRGVHVVVGHYMGDVNKPPGHSANLTEDILNANEYDPRPNEGKNGQPVMIPPYEHTRMQQLYQINSFNLLASDRIPLNRTLPDVRKKRCQKKIINLEKLPTTSVIIVFHNEAWSTLLRTVQSVIDRSPRSLLKEIILVDDASTRAFLGEPLEQHVSKLPVKTYVIRSDVRIGLIRARLLGAREAQGEILTFLDAHCECTIGWLENLLEPLAEDRTRVVCPVIDIINDDTFAYIRSFELHWGAFNWMLHFRWYTLGAKEMSLRKEDITKPFPTPVMAGGLFAMDKDYFFSLGSYDARMEVWGGENLELSFRVWMCGGSIEIAPCSHVGHVFRKSSPYSFPGGVARILYSNLARVALVWMDEWKEFYFKFNPGAALVRESQDVRSQVKLRERLNCHSFEWYLDNVWPQHFMPKDDRFFGQIKSLKTGECLEKPLEKQTLNQPVGYASLSTCALEPKTSIFQMFVMTQEGFIMTDESLCLDGAPEQEHKLKSKVRIMACNGVGRQKWKYDRNSKTLVNLQSAMCLTLPELVEGDHNLILSPCTGYANQEWELVSVSWK